MRGRVISVEELRHQEQALPARRALAPGMAVLGQHRSPCVQRLCLRPRCYRRGGMQGGLLN